jgi:hypothetical protein
VATSTREAKNIAVAEVTMEVLWNTKLWAELNGMHNPMTLCVDDQAEITLLSKRTAGVSGKTKQFDVA